MYIKIKLIVNYYNDYFLKYYYIKKNYKINIFLNNEKSNYKVS